MTIPLNFFVTLMLFSIPIVHVRSESYVREACSVTLYQDLCIRSLASYSHGLKRSPRRWARAAVSVTIREVKLLLHHLNYLKRQSHIIRGRRTRAALSDCEDCIQDTLDNLHRSLDVLRRLSYGAFDEQMNDVLTYLSAALTDEDTCIDGFGRRKGRRISGFCDKVQNTTYLTSNALALANKLATTGLHDLGEDHHDDHKHTYDDHDHDHEHFHDDP